MPTTMAIDGRTSGHLQRAQLAASLRIFAMLMIASWTMTTLVHGQTTRSDARTTKQRPSNGNDSTLRGYVPSLAMHATSEMTPAVFDVALSRFWKYFRYRERMRIISL